MAKKNKKDKKKINRAKLFDQTPWKDNMKQAEGKLVNPDQPAQPAGQPPKSKNRQSNDETRQRLANEREDRIAANKGKVTPIDELFLSTKGGRRAPPSGDWKNPTASNLDLIEKGRRSPEELARREAAVQVPKIDVGATMANADAARQVQQMMKDQQFEQNGVKTNAQGQKVAYQGGVPVGFEGKAPRDIIANPAERTSANVKDLISNSERGAIRGQAREVADASAPPNPEIVQDQIPPAPQSLGMPVVNEPTASAGENPLSAFVMPQQQVQPAQFNPADFGPQVPQFDTGSGALPSAPVVAPPQEHPAYSKNTFLGSPAGKAFSWLNNLLPTPYQTR